MRRAFPALIEGALARLDPVSRLWLKIIQLLSQSKPIRLFMTIWGMPCIAGPAEPVLAGMEITLFASWDTTTDFEP